MPRSFILDAIASSQADRRRYNFQTGLILLGLVALSLFFYYLGYQQLSLIKERESWPTVEATVVASEITQAEDSAPEVKVTFAYQLKGQEYRTIDYWDQFEKQGQIPEHLQVGKQLTIHYDPADPASAVLHPGSTSSAIYLFLFGSIPLLIASPFIAYWAVMRYVHYKMSVAKYHLGEAMKLMGEGREAMQKMQEEQGFVSQDLLDKEQETAAKAEEVRELLSGLVSDIAGPEAGVSPELVEKLSHEATRKFNSESPASAEDEMDPFSARAARAKRERAPLDIRKQWQTLLALCLPLAMGGVLSALSPYYTITCERTKENFVNCRIQQMIYGLFPYGEFQQVGNLQKVEGLRKGDGRTKYGYLRLEGDQVWEKPAGREVLSEKRIKAFLASDAPGPLRISDGKAVAGLWLPWMIGLFGIVAAVVTQCEWNYVRRKQLDEYDKTKMPPAKPPVAFAKGAYVTVGVVGLGFVIFVDVYQAGVQYWLLLVGLTALGGVINMAIQSWRQKKPGQSFSAGMK